jgi:hypothetical protein
MSLPHSQITNAEALISVFGYWPSFHDAEVVALSLSRAFNDDYGPALAATIHVFEMTSAVSSSGHFVCHKHSIVELRFRNIDDLNLEEFNHQNALNELSIKQADPLQSHRQFAVSFEGASGLDCTFICQHIEVLSITQGIPPNSVYASERQP